jgi:hypothetical protein
MGIPPHRYIVRLRLRDAVAQLADGEEDLSALAVRVGFASHRAHRPAPNTKVAPLGGSGGSNKAPPAARDYFEAPGRIDALAVALARAHRC